MHRLRWFLIGVLTVCVVIVAAAAVWMSLAHGFSANAPPSRPERWLAARARDAAMPADAAARQNPVPNTPEVLAEARAHWADHCAICHDNDGSGGTMIGTHTYPPAPDMRKEGTQHLSDGELFYIIQNGIRLSAMPAWATGSSHDEEDSWKLVRFIRHLPQLTFEEKKDMEKLNPKGPEDRQEEEDEEKFLNGEDTHEPTEHHHH
ncbi:MAG TPA: cytochrome c [Bryobacteraceae bacterium]|nr:cytochrome c [Bryobacteraceae bacterium]